MMFFFVGMYENKTEVYKYFLYSVIFLVAAGFLLYIVQPHWFLEYLAFVYNNDDNYATSTNAASVLEESLRFGSFFGNSYAISYYVTFAFCILILSAAINNYY